VRIVIVEDDPDIAALVARYAEKDGLSADIISSGSDALAAIRAQPPDVVVLDVMLPDVDGFEICGALRSDAKTAHIPILMMTARGDDASSQTTHGGLGANDYLAKPFSPKELIVRIRRLLSNRMS
jgi:two-component system response regulator BaeR